MASFDRINWWFCNMVLVINRSGTGITCSAWDSSCVAVSALMLELSEGREQDSAQILLAVRQAVAQGFDTTVGDIRVLPPRGLVKSTAGKVARPENRRRYLEMIGQG